ncbi:MAG: EAL domain-containing protein [Rhodocyclaceae bacterium]|nr:EAL domain-containing protein [Rhodocyclaceae bacterium]MBX3667091.1 EAL domain-containing protein [Rhodocyclaceae bacterium]
MSRTPKLLSAKLGAQGARRLFSIIWPFLAVVVVLAWAAFTSMTILSATRAYVSGESLWSKAQKSAVHHLLDYARTRDAVYFDRYLATIAVPLGDREARLELLKPAPDLDIVRRGFAAGRIHPDDVDGMIWLFRTFGNLSYMQRAISVWAEGDALIAELNSSARKLHERIAAGDGDNLAEQALVAEILRVDGELTPLEDEFSFTLGEAGRFIQNALTVAIWAAVVLLTLAGVALSQRMVRRAAGAEDALRESEERFKLAVTGSDDGIWDWNIANHTLFVSPRMLEMLGCDEAESLGAPELILDRVHPEDKAGTVQALDAHLREGAAYDIEHRLHTGSGEFRWFRTRGLSVRDGLGRPTRMAGSITDITDYKHAQAQLSAEKERALVTLASIGDAVIATGADGRIDYVNPVAEFLTGWKPGEAREQPLEAVFSIVDEATRVPVEHIIERAVSKPPGDLNGFSLLVRRDGSEVAVDYSAAPIHDVERRVAGHVLVFHDVSLARQHSLHLSYQASHDALTGLANRREFDRRLNQLMQGMLGMRRQHGVIMLNLDRFRAINDSCGFAVGDELLRQIAQLLQKRLREGDTLARLGGDGFGTLLENCSPEHALRIAEEVRRSVADLCFVWNGRSFSVSASLGLVVVGEPGKTVSEVVTAVEAACNMAKEDGGDRVQVFSAEQPRALQTRSKELEMAGRLRDALAHGKFRLFVQEVQPVLGPIQTGRHIELLLRLMNEDGTATTPAVFLPVAERHGLLSAIDRWVIDASFSALADLLQKPHALRLGLVSINLSTAALEDDKFVVFLKGRFERHQIPPALVCLELTESAALANLPRASAFVREMRDFGCRVALDDFGGGMSSLAFLKHLPVNFLKIHGTFIRDMADDPIDRAMVEAINAVGHVMGMRTIAEWVEEPAALRVLRAVGIDYAQGHYFGQVRPLEFLVRDTMA